MTRKRTREDLRRQLGVPCPYCDGKGFLKSPVTVCYEIFRDITREAPHMSAKQITLLTNPTVANVLFDEERQTLEHLEKRLRKRINVQTVKEYHLEQFEIVENAK